MTYTRRLRTAGTSVQASTRYVCSGSDFSPVAVHASTITSGPASATCPSLTFSPAGTTISPPAISTSSATHGGELIRGFGHASQYTRGRRFDFFAFRSSSANSRCIFRTSASADFARHVIFPSNRISAYTSASDRGFMAKKLKRCSSSLPTASCLYGTDPTTTVGRSATTSATDSMRQQSPTCGNPATGATSQHHFVTPTNNRRAPIAHKIEVALGASDTILTGVS